MATEEGQVFSCHTVEAWEQQLQKGNDSKKLVNKVVGAKKDELQQTIAKHAGTASA